MPKLTQDDVLKLIQEYDGISEQTAVLSILKDKPPDSDELRYTILLWLVGKVLMPPYLPRIIGRVQVGDRTEILERLARLVVQYEKSYSDHKLSDQEAKKILERVAIAGSDIAKHIPLDRCLRALSSDMGIKNLIIHTDEYAIPWHLAHSEFPGGELDFLCNRYSCGTILVDEAEEIENVPGKREEQESALSRFIKHSKLSKQPDIKELPDKLFCLIAGEVGQTTSEGKDLGLAYVEKLKGVVESLAEAYPYSKMKIQSVSAAEWARNEREPIDELRRIFRSAQVVHFTGHFVDGKMHLARNLKPIGPEDLTDHLPKLSSRPLVVLHGCASAGFAGSASGEGTKICRAFLNQGVGGCLATVLPVNIPTKFSEDVKTFMEIFYENVFKAPWKSYGSALQDARRIFRHRSKERLAAEFPSFHQLKDPKIYDPQILFYQLYGDPRETLVLTRQQTVPEFIVQMEEKTAATVRLSGEGINEQEVLQALRDVAGVLQASPQDPVVPLGVVPPGSAEIVSEIGWTCFTTVLAISWAIFKRIEPELKKRFGPALKVEITHQHTVHN